MKRRIVTILLIQTLIGLFIVPLGVSATTSSGTQIINEDEYWTFTIPMEGGGTLSYVIQVTNGPRIDILLFDETNYAHYRAGESSYYNAGGSDLDTVYADVEVSLSSGTYYLVVDNTDYGGAAPPWDGVNNPATVEYDITYSSSAEAVGWLCIIGGLIILIVIIVVVVILLMRKKEKPSNYQQPSTTYTPQQPQYAQPLQQPAYTPPPTPQQQYPPQAYPPQPTQTPPPQQPYPCQTCGQPLRYINEYQKWYCDTCRRYV